MNGARLSIALAILALVYALAALYSFPKWTVDDAYITYRYAENLANFGALTWNVGEKPVEGYTGVALPLILAAGIRLGIPPDSLSSYQILANATTTMSFYDFSKLFFEPTQNTVRNVIGVANMNHLCSFECFLQ